MPSYLIPNFETTSCVHGGSAKLLGAFYTEPSVAEFLVSWAVRSAQDRVLDPSFGGGVFLQAACKRLLQLGGKPACQVFGSEIRADAQARVLVELSEQFGLQPQNLLMADFFGVEPLVIPLWTQ